MSHNLFGKMNKLCLHPLLAPEDSSPSVVIRNLLLVCGSVFLVDSSSYYFFSLWLHLFQFKFILFHIGGIGIMCSILDEAVAALSAVLS